MKSRFGDLGSPKTTLVNGGSNVGGFEPRCNSEEWTPVVSTGCRHGRIRTSVSHRGLDLGSRWVLAVDMGGFDPRSNTEEWSWVVGGCWLHTWVD